MMFKIVKYNYNKGGYDGMRQSFQINWKEFLPLCMTKLIPSGWFFKQEVHDKIDTKEIEKIKKGLLNL